MRMNRNCVLIQIFLCIFSLNLLIVASSDEDKDLLVSTDRGSVKGHQLESGIREFLGIPYASPPIGDLRFANTEDVTPWETVYEANFIAPGCAQHCKLPPGNCPATYNEDCLYLNIWTPPSSGSDSNELLPVMVWLHGGAFEQGSGNSGLYLGDKLAAQNIIVVTLNYRLGIFATLATHSQEGNYAMQDQRKAMEFVSRNIQKFGGDPQKITLAGQSAGAMSVGGHLLSQKSEGLFQAAIMESNPLSLPFNDRTTVSDKMVKYVQKSTKCSDKKDDDVFLQCLRNMTTEEILSTQDSVKKHYNIKNVFDNFLHFAPLVDPEGNDLKIQPLKGLQNNAYRKMPIITGSNLEDGFLFVMEIFPKPLKKLEYDLALETVFGYGKGKKIKKKYPASSAASEDDLRPLIGQIATDVLFHCSIRNASIASLEAQNQQQSSTIDLYNYVFSHVPSFNPWGDNFKYCDGHVCHGIELPFVFDNYALDDLVYNPTQEELELTKIMLTSWTSFIKSYNPNLETISQLNWPTINVEQLNQDGSNFATRSFDVPDQEKILLNYRTEYCDFWDGLGYTY